MNLTRSLRFKEILHEKEFNEESIVYNKSNIQFKTKNLDLEYIVNEIEIIETEYKCFTSNISNEEQNTFKDIMNNPNTILKPTHKGGGLVSMENSYYRDSLVTKGYLGSNVCQEE